MYLVNQSWFNKIKNYYNYEVLKEKLELKKEITNQDLEIMLKEMNILNLYTNIQNKQIEELNLIKSENFQPIFEETQNEKIRYPKDFDIINEETFEEIIQKKDYSRAIKCPCIINNGMIIIKFIKNDEKKEYFLILIGKIDINSNKFCFDI